MREPFVLEMGKLSEAQLRERCRCGDDGGDCEFCLEQFFRDEARPFTKPAQTVEEFKANAQEVREYREAHPNAGMHDAKRAVEASKLPQFIAATPLTLAAPDLLEALEHIAIEAARGAESIGPSTRRGDQSRADTFRFIRDSARAAIAKARGAE